MGWIKGYITNTDINAECVIDQYHGLWVVERKHPMQTVLKRLQ